MSPSLVSSDATAIPDSAIPKPLRDAIRERRRAAIELETAVRAGLTPRVFVLAEKLADLNRSLRSHDWLPRVAGFDPIALGC